MRAVVYEGPGDIRLKEVPEPEILDPEDAIVRVTTASICGSDLHIMHGLLPKMEPGRIIGHEFVGVVHKVGDQVKRFKPGDRVVGPAAVWCGRCRPCMRGVVSACERGATFGHGPLLGDLPGSQADYVRVPFSDVTLQPIPGELSDEQVIFAGDVLPTAYSAVVGLSPGGRGVRAEDNVVIFGLGPIGLCAVACAKLFDPARVIAVGNRAERLAMAAQLGADAVVDAASEDVRKRVRELTEGWGADYVVEAVGKQESLGNSVAVCAPGGMVSVVGAFQQPTTINAPRMQARNITVSMGLGDLSLMKDLIQLIQLGRLDLTPLITHRLSLDQAVHAYEIFDKRLEGAIKVLLTT
ncbi:MAG: alcohol dehydrogenase catalytic domain-containing protein [Thermoleophilia bacterium]|nr:alcohol dehydrogenase catalytic domain-containing protein [Thermoleophilia bacterium]